MALQKSFTSPYGVPADYICVTDAQFNFDGEEASVTLKAWINQAAHGSGTSHVALFRVGAQGAVEEKDENGVFTKLRYSDVLAKTPAEIQAVMATGKIRFGSEIVDLTTATPV